MVIAKAYVPKAATPTISTSPTAPAIVSVTPTPIAPISVKATTPPDYQLANLILMGIYVFLTLVVAIGAIWSVFITRAALNASKEQSHEALAASEKQSKAAIDAVKQQIDASEKQSKAAIDAVHEQIEQSSQPILIPLSPLPLTAGIPQLDYSHSELSLNIMNVGTGVALNIWGLLVPPKNIPKAPYSFSNQAHILQSKEETVHLRMGQFEFFTESDKMGEFDLWPSSEVTLVGTTNIDRYAARLTLTYIDVFGIKHAVFNTLGGAPTHFV